MHVNGQMVVVMAWRARRCGAEGTCCVGLRDGVSFCCFLFWFLKMGWWLVVRRLF